MDDETRAMVAQVTRSNAVKFLVWWNNKTKMPMDRAFTQWWLLHGPTLFYDVSDATRFKREVREQVDRVLDEINTLPKTDDDAAGTEAAAED